MKPTRFRAYAAKTVESRREVDGEKQNIDHDVEDVAFDGKLVDGVASFDAGDVKVSRVVFYGGPAGEEFVLGDMPLNRAGKISAEFVEA